MIADAPSKTGAAADSDSGDGDEDNAASQEAASDGGSSENEDSTKSARAVQPTIASVYSGSTGGASVSKWIEKHRCKEGKAKDLYLSDDSEGRFLEAMKVGAEITRTQVIDTLLRNSFNLNPAILSVVEMEMADSRTDEATKNTRRVSSEEPRRTPWKAPPTAGKGNIDVILAALEQDGDAAVDWGSC